MRKDAVEVLAAFVDYRCQADDFRACAYDYQKFEATVVLEGYVAIVCFQFHYSTGSKYVSGLLGLKISLQYITVTRFSVSERLMML